MRIEEVHQVCYKSIFRSFHQMDQVTEWKSVNFVSLIINNINTALIKSVVNQQNCDFHLGLAKNIFNRIIIQLLQLSNNYLATPNFQRNIARYFSMVPLQYHINRILVSKVLRFLVCTLRDLPYSNKHLDFVFR